MQTRLLHFKYLSLKQLVLTILLAAFITPSLFSAGLYRWVDEHGVVHFGDSIPSKYSKVKREKLSSQGVIVDTLDAEKTKEELLAEELAKQQKIEQERLAKLKAHRDNILLSSYFTLEDIDKTRDEKISQLDKQMELLDINLENLVEEETSLHSRISIVENGNAQDKQTIIDRFNSQLVKNSNDQNDVISKKDALKAEIYRTIAYYAKEAADYTVLKQEKAELNTNP